MDPDETLPAIVQAVLGAALADGMDANLKSLQIDFGDTGVTLRATPETGEVYEGEMSAEDLADALDAETGEEPSEVEAETKTEAAAEKPTEKPAAPEPTPATPAEGEKKAA